jgi:hypothetical protein
LTGVVDAKAIQDRFAAAASELHRRYRHAIQGQQEQNQTVNYQILHIRSPSSFVIT